MNNDHIIEDIRSKTDIVELVRNYTELRNAGRNYKGLCPFHREKTPSFMVSPEKQIAYCFGCQKGGDIFAFVMEVERVEFPEAVRFLAERARIDLPANLHSGPKRSDREEMIQVMKEAMQFYHKALGQNEQAQKYLKERGLSQETITSFGLGYAPDKGDSLISHLTSLGFSPDLLLKVGLITRQESQYRDKFRNRIMFPIKNIRGDAIAFGGRILGEGEPKYLNSPETPLYHKSHVLFGLFEAKDEIKEIGYVLIVEGYMDMISCYQHGCKNVVAVSGTAFTEEQITLLKRYTEHFVLAFDNDTAGWNASKKNTLLCLEKDIHPKILLLSAFGVKDLDDFFQTQTKEILTVSVEKSPPVFDALLDRITKSGLGTLELKRRAAEETLPFLKHMRHAIEKEHYLKKAAGVLGVSIESLINELKKIKIPKKHELVSESLQKQVIREQLGSPGSVLAAIFIHYPELFREYQSYLVMEDLDGEVQNSVYKLLKSEYTFDADLPTKEALIQLFPKEKQQQLLPLLMYAEDQGILASQEVARKIAKEKIRILLEKEKNSLLSGLKKAQEAKDSQQWKQLFQRLSHIQSLAL